MVQAAKKNAQIHAPAPVLSIVQNNFDTVRQWSLIELFGNAEASAISQDAHSSSALYKTWIAGNDNHPALHAAYFNYAISLSNSGDRPGAINALRECIRLKQDFAPAYINLGRILEDNGDPSAAVMQWFTMANQLKAVDGENVKHKLLALQQIGRVLEGHERDGAAEDALKQALDINVHQPEVIQHWIALRQRQCKWPVVEGSDYSPAKTLMAGISPLSLANLLDDPVFQIARACKYSREMIRAPEIAPRRWPTPAATAHRGKLRIGYVSSDLREHAVGFAMTDVFELHDKRSFEIHAYYCGIGRTDSTQGRIRSAADSWTDINPLSDEQAAEKIAKDKIDILVDLNGYTRDARTRVFSLRPAPVIVNWFGFPGTMGTSYHNYIVADEHIIPEDHEIFFSEKVLRLPCYQPNDRRRPVAECPSRADENLPANALVFCCLNGMQKLTREVFLGWIEILAGVKDSVLWLLGGSGDTVARLRQLAEENGVSGGRLIFAQKKPNPLHLARYQLADLFLDTFPYGAHTTAADSLWMGVPVLTRRGLGFASRVCSSVVSAAGLGELVCDDQRAYVAKAIELGRNPKALDKLKKKLKTGRGTCLLFDTPRLVEGLEALYRGMWEDYRRGALPRPELGNMDAYAELGARLHTAGPAPEGGELLARYRQELEVWNETWPLVPDARLWRAN